MAGASPGPATINGFLAPEVVRTMVWSRLRALAGELMGPSAAVWHTFARQWNHSFTPAVPWPPGQGTTALGHAARSCTGHGLAWQWLPSGWRKVPADQVLRVLAVDPVPWDTGFVRDFVSGDEAELACALHCQLRLRSLTETGMGCAARLRASGVGDPSSDPRGMSAAARLHEPYVLWAGPLELSALFDEVVREGELLVHEAECRTDYRARAVARALDRQVRGAGMLAFFTEQQLLALGPVHHGSRPGRGRRPGHGPGDCVIATATTRLAAIRSLRREGTHGPATVTHALEALDHARWIITALGAALAEQPGTGCGCDPSTPGGTGKRPE
ncbi:hypothetical protein ACFYOR_33095 [Streptomyces griseofuscus]|uniref:hypothetical protein n=1 Tax=Streptomyces TaxID=1883 RepID=UPI0018F091D1|nr:hypothetical protein [Streptomyces sp. CRPSP2-6A1]MBJ7002393.1 hypothetical protein [Streptomyces sp. CRPSP2-6A1]